MNVFLRELKANRKSLIVWCLMIFLLVVMSIAKFEGIKTGGQDVSKLLDSMPKVVKAIFAMGSHDITKIDGYFSVVYSLTVIAVACHSAMLGSGIISKEEADKTTEFLFVKPKSRNKIVTSKIFAVVFNIIVLNLITLISSVVFVKKYGDGVNITNEILVLMFGMFLIQLLFASIGILISVISKKSKTAPSRTTSIILIAYIISIFVNMSDKLTYLEVFSPFKYFDPEKILFGASISYEYVVLSLAITCICVTMSYVLFKKKDLNI